MNNNPWLNNKSRYMRTSEEFHKLANELIRTGKVKSARELTLIFARNIKMRKVINDVFETKKK